MNFRARNWKNIIKRMNMEINPERTYLGKKR